MPEGQSDKGLFFAAKELESKEAPDPDTPGHFGERVRRVETRGEERRGAK